MEDREKRDQHRSQVAREEINGLLTIEGQGAQQPFLIWDVSPEGIGIWATSEVPEGTQVVLTIGQPFLMVLVCTVSWAEKQSGHDGCRLGLTVKEEYQKVFSTLTRVFEAAG